MISVNESRTAYINIRIYCNTIKKNKKITFFFSFFFYLFLFYFSFLFFAKKKEKEKIKTNK